MALGDIKGELIADINKETKKGIFTNKYTWATSIEDDSYFRREIQAQAYC